MRKPIGFTKPTEGQINRMETYRIGDNMQHLHERMAPLSMPYTTNDNKIGNFGSSNPKKKNYGFGIGLSSAVVATLGAGALAYYLANRTGGVSTEHSDYGYGTSKLLRNAVKYGSFTTGAIRRPVISRPEISRPEQPMRRPQFSGVLKNAMPNPQNPPSKF